MTSVSTASSPTVIAFTGWSATIISVATKAIRGERRRRWPTPPPTAAKKELTGPDLVVSFRYYQAGKLTVPPPAPTDGAATTNPATTKPAKFKNPEHLIFADEAYFTLLPYQWLAGSPAFALTEPGRVVLSESRAKLYFPTLTYAGIIGQTIVYDDTISARGSGIV